MPSPATPPPSSKRDWASALLLLGAVLLAYQPAWHGQALWDDDRHLTPPGLRSIEGLANVWTHSRESMQYFPLVHSVFWVGANLWGDSPLGFHLLSILLHVLSALLLAKILRRLGAPGPWLAAAIFALHPVMVESVAWMSELKNTLSGACFLAAALAYSTYVDSGSRRSYLLALALFVLGLLAKSTIAPFPLAMLLVVWWKRGRLSWKRDIVPLLPCVLLAIPFGLMALRVEQTHLEAREANFALSLVERGLVAGRAIWFYLGKVFLPIDLIFSYPRWAPSATVWWQYLFPAATLLLGVAVWVVRKTWRAPAAVFFYFAAMLLPYLGFIRFYTFRYSFVADHYQYLAAIGPIVLGVGFLATVPWSSLRHPAVVRTFVSGALLLALWAASWRQSGMYANAEVLYRTTVARNDHSWLAHNGLGIELAKTNRLDEALTHYRRALELHPDFAEAHNNLCLLLSDMGRTDEALTHCRRALDLDPGRAKAENSLGVVLARMGRSAEALVHYERALRLAPHYAEAHHNLGALLAGMGRTEAALTRYQRALDLEPRHAGARNNLGVLLVKLGRADEAMAHYRKALAVDPNLGSAHFNLAGLLADRERDDEALVHYQRAVELDADRPEPHYNLGLLLAKMGRGRQAMAHYQRSLELDPNQADAHNNLGILMAGMGLLDQAVAHFRSALEIDPHAVGFLKNLAVALAQGGRVADATSLLEQALASARSSGDQLRERQIAQAIATFHALIDSAGIDRKPRRQP